MSAHPGPRLTFTSVGDEYLGHVEGLGAVYRVYRSPYYGDRWAASEMSATRRWPKKAPTHWPTFLAREERDERVS
jgi:hypothetical protein